MNIAKELAETYAGANRVPELEQQLAACQAREKVLRDACTGVVASIFSNRLEAYKEIVTYLKDDCAKALAQPYDDSALQDLILKERTRAIESWKAIHLKAALAAERERIATYFENRGETWASGVIRALGDEPRK